jgi:hypothetical protein
MMRNHGVVLDLFGNDSALLKHLLQFLLRRRGLATTRQSCSRFSVRDKRREVLSCPVTRRSKSILIARAGRRGTPPWTDVREQIP